MTKAAKDCSNAHSTKPRAPRERETLLEERRCKRTAQIFRPFMARKRAAARQNAPPQQAPQGPGPQAPAPEAPDAPPPTPPPPPRAEEEHGPDQPPALTPWPPAPANSEAQALATIQPPQKRLQDQREALAALETCLEVAHAAARVAPPEGLPADNPEAAMLLEHLRATAAELETSSDLSSYALLVGPALSLLRQGFPERVTPGAASATIFIDPLPQLLRKLQIAARADLQRLSLRVRESVDLPPPGAAPPRVPSFSLIELSDARRRGPRR